MLTLLSLRIVACPFCHSQSPAGSQLVRGWSVAFTTCCGGVIEENLVRNDVAVHLTLGNAGKNGSRRLCAAWA